MAELEQLLTVQAHDTAVDQLEHRKAHLPIHDGLSQARSALEAAEADLRRAMALQKAAEAERARLEAEVAGADERIATIEKRLFGGSVSSSRDLESMSTEVSHLKERRSALEDDALVAMDGAESAAAEQLSAKGRVDELAAEVVRLEAELGVAEGEVDALIEQERAQRTAAAADLSDALMGAYEKLRSRLAGVGAARLVGDSCSGCHLSLPSGELERLRREPPEALCYCDNCQRILVR